MKTFVYRSFMGVIFGGFLHVLLVGIGILWWGAETINTEIFLKNAIGMIICSWFFTVTPLYFSVEKWNLIQQTILHFLTVIILFFIVAFTIGWIPISLPVILMQTLIFLAIYVVSWTLFFLYFRYQARILNENIKRL